MKDEVTKKCVSQIDKYNLDGELVSQPELYEEYAIQLEEARADVEEAKNELKVRDDDYDVACAKMDLVIRKYPATYGIDKLTESVIRSAIILAPDVVQAKKAIYTVREELVRLQRVYGALHATVGALDCKKRSLEDLCKLRLANYYSEPRLPKSKEDIRSDIEDKKRRKMYQKNREASNVGSDNKLGEES